MVYGTQELSSQVLNVHQYSAVKAEGHFEAELMMSCEV